MSLGLFGRGWITAFPVPKRSFCAIFKVKQNRMLEDWRAFCVTLHPIIMLRFTNLLLYNLNWSTEKEELLLPLNSITIFGVYFGYLLSTAPTQCHQMYCLLCFLP